MIVLLAVMAALAAAIVIVAVRPHATKVTTTSSTVPTTAAPVTTGAPATVTTAAPATSTTAPAWAAQGYQPLWPFSTIVEAAAWEASYRSGGTQPWHLDAGATALSFTASYLQYPAVNAVVQSDFDAKGAHIAVGYQAEGHIARAAVIHLVRFGTSAVAPWEVVGTDDDVLTVTTPVYGATVGSPLTVGGHITGVDESLDVRVWSLSSSTAVGHACCTPAGGENTPWSTTVSFNAHPGEVLTIAVSTGGHLQQVERFAVTGVVAR